MAQVTPEPPIVLEQQAEQQGGAALVTDGSASLSWPTAQGGLDAAPEQHPTVDAALL